jgi:hypothetical protein
MATSKPEKPACLRWPNQTRCRGGLGGGHAWSGWGRNGARRKGGDGGPSTPFEMGTAVRAIGQKRVGLGVPHGGGEGGGGTGQHGGRPAAARECVEAETVVWCMERGGMWLTCGPVATIPGGGKI